MAYEDLGAIITQCFENGDKEKTYVVAAKGNLADCLSAAREQGYVTDKFKQTVHQDDNGHLRVRKDDLYGRIISVGQAGLISYVFLIPKKE